MIKKFYIEFIILVSLGALTSLSLPPYNYFIINFLTFSLYFIFLLQKSNLHKNKKLFFFYGWSFGFGYFVTNLYWISISLTFDQEFKFLIPFTVFLIPAFLAIFFGLISFFFIIFKTKKIISSFFVFSLIFGILEFIRGSVLTGFPWNLIAYSFSNQLEILSITSIVGTYGFNLFCISLFTSPAIIILKETRKDMIVSIFFLISIIFLYANGLFYKDKFNNTIKESHEYKIRVIGSNISLERFYAISDPILVIEDLIEISNPKLGEKTIFVWPEGIIPDLYQDELDQYNWLFKKYFNENHLLIIGITKKISKNNSNNYYNSLSVYDNELRLLESYNKTQLVPFGEFLPFENFLKNFGLRSLTNNYQSFSNGVQRDVIKIDKNNFNLKFLPLICYEIIYSGKLFDNLDFDYIINLSEDGWFGKSIGPKQHFDHSILRAIESGKYVLRSANNGVAAIINPLGEIEQKVKFGDSGYIDIIESRKIQPTIFSKFGNKIFVLVILLYIFLIFSFNRFKK